MHALFSGLTAFAATATPIPQQTVDPELVTPGPWGFVAIAFVALAVVLLVFDMLRRIRRGRYRDEVREELDAEEQAVRAAAATEVDDQRTDADADATDEAGPGESPDTRRR